MPLSGSYAVGDPASFNRAAAELHTLYLTSQPGVQHQADSEIIFNRMQPFYASMVIYVLALLALLPPGPGNATCCTHAFGLLVAGSIVHTGGLISRILLQGRPPVTNLLFLLHFCGLGRG